MTLLNVRNHYRIIYIKVLENTAKTGMPFISTYNYFDFHISSKRAGFFSRVVRSHPVHTLSYATGFEKSDKQ